MAKIFPPVVTGPTVILIGVALITTGIEEWGGGTYCASQVIIALLLIFVRLKSYYRNSEVVVVVVTTTVSMLCKWVPLNRFFCI